MRRKWKIGLSAVAAAACIVTSAAAVSAEAAGSRESIPSWAAEEIAAWQKLGLLKGNESGYVLPNAGVKKAEFAAFVNRVFRYGEGGAASFKDVPSHAWYASDIGKAAAAGLIVGDDNGYVAPLEPLTREKAAIILYKAFQMKPAESSTVQPFRDDVRISSWAKEAVYALKAAGFAAGTPEGDFLPQKTLTRAEAVKMIDNAMGSLIADSGVHTGMNGQNLVVNTAGGTLSDTVLKGDLYLTAGVGDGEFTLSNVEVGGTIYVDGGGEHSIILKDSKAGKIVVHKPASPVRIALNGSTTVQDVSLLSGGRIENGTTSPVGQLTVQGSGQPVTIVGPVRLLSVNTKSSLKIGTGEIGELIVGNGAGGSIELETGARIVLFTANAGVNVTGEGTVGEAVINAPGVALTRKPDKITMNTDQIQIGGSAIGKDQLNAPVVTGGGSDGSGGNSGNGGDGGGGSTPKATELYTYAEALSGLGSTKAESLVKQYLTFLQDPAYTPSIANPSVSMPNLPNAGTFVNYQFDIKPSLFPSLRNINTSVLNDARTVLWIGTNEGVMKIALNGGATTAYTAANHQLKDDQVMLLISDGASGVFAITHTGVSHIYQ